MAINRSGSVSLVTADLRPADLQGMMERRCAHPRHRIIFVVSRRKRPCDCRAHHYRHANEGSGHKWPERTAAEHRLLPSLSQAYSMPARGDLKLQGFLVPYFGTFLTD